MGVRNKSLRDFVRFAENPTSAKHKIQGLHIGSRYRETNVVQVDGDEVVGGYEESRWKPSVNDTLQFVKLFSEAQAQLVSLTSSGVAVFCYVLMNLKKEHDEITIIPAEFGKWYNSLEGCEEANYRMVHYRGVLNLLDHEFLFLKVGEGHYFINVNKFFNGNRCAIGWVDEINERLKKGEEVRKREVEFDENYKPKVND